MTEQIAQSILEDYGDFAHLFALGKLEANPDSRIWRDVLSWLDDLTKQGEPK